MKNGDTKKLGSLLGDYHDFKGREQLSNTAMASLQKIWKDNINKKLKIYITLVKPILTYNYSTWALTKSEENELGRVHRKQLRRIWKDYNKPNNKVYEDSKEGKLSDEMRIARFGHILYI